MQEGGSGNLSAGDFCFLAESVRIYTDMSAVSEDLGEKAFLGENKREAVIHFIITPAVVAVLVIVSTLVSTCFWKCASS